MEQKYRYTEDLGTIEFLEERGISNFLRTVAFKRVALLAEKRQK